MKNKLFPSIVPALFGTLLLLCCGCESILEEMPMTTSITFAELEGNMRKAIDPGSRLPNLKGYTQCQLITTSDFWGKPEEQYVTVKYQKPDRLSMTTTRHNGKTEGPSSGMVINEHGGWSIDYEKKKLVKMGDEQLHLCRELLRLDDFVTRLRSDFAKVEIRGVRIGEESYYKLTCHLKEKGEKPIIAYVGMTDFLVHRLQFTLMLKIGDFESETTIHRYALMDGVMLPVETSVECNGETKKTRIVSHKYNPEFGKRTFEPPMF